MKKLIVYFCAFLNLLAPFQAWSQTSNKQNVKYIQIDYDLKQYRVISEQGHLISVRALPQYTTSNESLTDEAVNKTIDYLKKNQISDLENKQKFPCSISSGFFYSPVIRFEIDSISRDTFDSLILELKNIKICSNFDYF